MKNDIPAEWVKAYFVSVGLREGGWVTSRDVIKALGLSMEDLRTLSVFLSSKCHTHFNNGVKVVSRSKGKPARYHIQIKEDTPDA